MKVTHSVDWDGKLFFTSREGHFLFQCEINQFELISIFLSIARSQMAPKDSPRTSAKPQRISVLT